MLFHVHFEIFIQVNCLFIVFHFQLSAPFLKARAPVSNLMYVWHRAHRIQTSRDDARPADSALDSA